MAKLVQRKTTNLGINTARSQDESYSVIEAIFPTAKCTDKNHIGDRILPVRNFYLNNGGKSLQGACSTCQKLRRKNRIIKCRETFSNLNADEIRERYQVLYGPVKTCSSCKESKPPNQFMLSISMECGLHNQCISCSIGTSQGNGGLRDFIFMPDKDGKKYIKKNSCERCGGTNKLAVDHILPIAKGGTDCITNKQTLCVHCNSKKSDTIDCIVSYDQLCVRYRDTLFNFSDFTTTSQHLSKKVYEFRYATIDSSSLDDIRTSISEYKKVNNLGADLDRICNKIAILFHK